MKMAVVAEKMNTISVLYGVNGGLKRRREMPVKKNENLLFIQ